MPKTSASKLRTLRHSTRRVRATCMLLPALYNRFFRSDTCIMSDLFHEKFTRDIKTARERELPFVGKIKEKLDKEFMGDFPPAKINWFAVFFTCLTTLETPCK